MAKKKIPELPVASALQDNDLFIIEQAAGTRKVELASIIEYIDLSSLLNEIENSYIKYTGNVVNVDPNDIDPRAISGSLLFKENDGDDFVRLFFYDSPNGVYNYLHGFDGFHLKEGVYDSGFEIYGNYVQLRSNNNNFRGITMFDANWDDAIADEPDGASLVPARYVVSRRGTSVDSGQRVTGNIEFETGVGVTFWDNVYESVAYIRADEGLSIREGFQYTGFQISPDDISIYSQSSSFEGLKYNQDLSANFTEFSLINKSWVEDYVAVGLSDLQSALDGKANSSHSHSISNITGLQSALDSKANSAHTHSIGDISGLQSALDAKANSSHSHSISNISGLQTALNAKADASDFLRLNTSGSPSVSSTGNFSISGGGTLFLSKSRTSINRLSVVQDVYFGYDNTGVLGYASVHFGQPLGGSNNVIPIWFDLTSNPGNTSLIPNGCLWRQDNSQTGLKFKNNDTVYTIKLES